MTSPDVKTFKICTCSNTYTKSGTQFKVINCNRNIYITKLLRNSLIWFFSAESKAAFQNWSKHDDKQQTFCELDGKWWRYLDMGEHIMGMYMWTCRGFKGQGYRVTRWNLVEISIMMTISKCDTNIQYSIYSCLERSGSKVEIHRPLTVTDIQDSTSRL